MVIKNIKEKYMKYLSLVLLIFILSCSTQGQSNHEENSDSIYYMHEMSAYLDTSFLNRYEEDIIEYERRDSISGITKGQVLFIGSSSIHKWVSLEEDMFPIPVINRGFGGSTLPEVIYYFKRIVKPYKPSVIVLYEGDNDITAESLTHEVVLESFKLFVRLTKKHLPNTHVYFLSVKPSPAREIFLDKLLITNTLLEEYCNENNNLFYIDITGPMYDQMGEIRRDIFLRDKLHLNEKGYKIWSKIIKDALLKNNNY